MTFLLPSFRRVSRPENAKSLADAAVSEAVGVFYVLRARVYNAARTGPQTFDDDDDEIMKAFI